MGATCTSTRGWSSGLAGMPRPSHLLHRRPVAVHADLCHPCRLEFCVGGQPLNNFRMIERHYFKVRAVGEPRGGGPCVGGGTVLVQPAQQLGPTHMHAHTPLTAAAGVTTQALCLVVLLHHLPPLLVGMTVRALRLVLVLFAPHPPTHPPTH